MSDISHVAFGLLSNYIRFINLDRSERSKCSILPLWEKFVCNADRIKLYTKVSKKTIEDKKDWFDRQVGPTYAQIIDNDGGAFIYDNIKKWQYKGGVTVG